MNRLALIGILLVIFALAVLYISAWQVESSFTSGQLMAMSLQSNTVRYSQFNLTNTTAIGIVYYTNSTPITYLLLNATGFANALSYINSSNSLYSNSNSLEGNGALEMVWGSPTGLFPSQNNLTTYEYDLNQSPELAKGSYYNVFDNLGQPNATVYYSIIEKTPAQISNSILSNAVYGIIGAALFIGGIIAMLYSIFMGKAATKETVKDEEAYKMYESMDRKTEKGRRPRKSRRRHSGRA